MIKTFLLCLGLLTSAFLFAQEEHKILLDFTKGDTVSFSTVARHAKNIVTLAPNAKVEIVCHGHGLDLIVREKTTIAADLQELSEKYKVAFVACEASMKRRGVDKSQLLSLAITVPSAILEISSKEQEGWTYVKE